MDIAEGGWRQLKLTTVLWNLCNAKCFIQPRTFVAEVVPKRWTGKHGGHMMGDVFSPGESYVFPCFSQLADDCVLFDLSITVAACAAQESGRWTKGTLEMGGVAARWPHWHPRGPSEILQRQGRCQMPSKRSDLRCHPFKSEVLAHDKGKKLVPANSSKNDQRRS